MDYIYTTRFKKIKTGFDDVLNFWFFGDIHRDTKFCDTDRWKWFLKRAEQSMKEKPTYFFGMGDYHDFASTTEKKKIRNSDLHDTTLDTFDEMAETRNRKLAQEIGFMRGYLLGLITGNHIWLYQNGTSSTDDLAERLASDSLGWLCHYTLCFEFPGNKYQSVSFVLCHGRAGGKTAGVTINQVDDLRKLFPAADVYVMGHDHQRGAWPKSVLLPMANGEIKQKRQFLCRSGSYKRAYVNDASAYEIGRLYSPADLGSLMLTLSFHRDQRNKQDRIITDISAVI